MSDPLKKVLAAVLGLAEDQVSDDISMQSTPQWDSLRHMKLILAIEQEFDIEFDDEEIHMNFDAPSIRASIKAKQSA